MTVALGIPIVEKGGKILLTKDNLAIERQKHEFHLVKVSICYDVYLRQHSLEMLKCDLTLS